MQSFVQFLIIGLGAGATYALFAQGAVLIYRGSGLVNFAQGAIGTFAAYIAFVDLKDKQGLDDAARDRRRGARRRARCRSCSRWSSSARCGAPRRSSGSSPRSACSASSRPSSRSATAWPTGRSTPTSPTTCSTWGGIHRPGGADLPRRHHPGRDRRALGLDPVHPRRAGHQRQRPERTGGADARVVARPPRRPHLDDRRDARRARRRARRAAHRAVGRHLHDRGDRGRARRRAARRLPVLPVDARSAG